MKKMKIFLIVFSVFVSFQLSAGEFLPDGAELDYSVLVNTIPDETNDTIPDEYLNQVDHTAMHIQFNFSWKPEDGIFEFIGLKSQPYYSIRYMQRVHVDDEDPLSGAIENINALTLLYGDRYFFNDFGYQGPALGWYSGFAIGNGQTGYTWDQNGPFQQTVYDKFDDIGFIGAFELLFTYTLYKTLTFEASYTVGWFEDSASIKADFPALLIGYQF